jgi:hypothetical protein
MLDVHIKNPKPMKYVPAQLSSFLRRNKIEKCLFRLSGLFGLTELNSALLAAFLSLRLTHSTFVLNELSNLLLFLRCFLDVLTATTTFLTDFPRACTKFSSVFLDYTLKQKRLLPFTRFSTHHSTLINFFSTMQNSNSWLRR